MVMVARRKKTAAAAADAEEAAVESVLNKSDNQYEQIYQRVGRRQNDGVRIPSAVIASGRALYAQHHRQRQLGPPGVGGGRGLLLCCVCDEQNTTYRYEVVYRSPDVKGTLFAIPDKNTLFDDDHAYYNFPPRHPRHGHLKWPVLDSAAVARSASPLTQSTCVDEGSLCLTYPDYPVHIQTTTLPRRLSAVPATTASVAGSGGTLKRKKKLKKKAQKKAKKSSVSTRSSSTSSSCASPVDTKSKGRIEEQDE